MALYISVVSVHTVTCEPLLVGHGKDLQLLDSRNSGIYPSISTIFDDILWYIYLPINSPMFLRPELCQRANVNVCMSQRPSTSVIRERLIP